MDPKITNVIPFVPKARPAGDFEMPSNGGVKSNGMTYTDSLQVEDCAKFIDIAKKTLGPGAYLAAWTSLDPAKVQDFLRAWYGDQSLTLIEVKKCLNDPELDELDDEEGPADSEAEPDNWELYFHR